MPGLISVAMGTARSVFTSGDSSVSHPLVPAGKGPTRRSRTRSNRPAWGARVRRSQYIHRNIGTRRSAWSRSQQYGASHGHGVADGSQTILVGADIKRFFVPLYVGHKGWIGMRLDNKVDWREVAEIAKRSYRMTASKKAG
jgi:hypothetical protein